VAERDAMRQSLAAEFGDGGKNRRPKIASRRKPVRTSAGSGRADEAEIEALDVPPSADWLRLGLDVGRGRCSSDRDWPCSSTSLCWPTRRHPAGIAAKRHDCDTTTGGFRVQPCRLNPFRCPSRSVYRRRQ
jgi:hypothetical protein